MLGFRFKSYSPRRKTPVRLHATSMSILSLIALVISVVFTAAKLIVLAIIPPPVKQETVKPWLTANQRLFIVVKAWLYSMYARWHIDTGERVFATPT